MLSRLLFTDISDHFPGAQHLPNFVIHYEHSKNNEESKPFVFFRDKNKENESKFRDSLRNIDWQNIYNENDANITYNSFLNKYFDIYNSCFLLKKVKAWKCSLKTPWLYIGGLAKIH